MATRCQIGIYEKANMENDKFTALIYRHWDGYPEDKGGVLAQIIPFIKEFKRLRGYDDEYLSARLLQYMTNENDKANEGKAGELVSDTLSYGICKSFHSDIAYFYKIEPNKVKVYKVNSFENQVFNLVKEVSTE